MINYLQKNYFKKPKPTRPLLVSLTFLIISTACSQERSIKLEIAGPDTTLSITAEGTIDAINTRRYQQESIFKYNGSGVENNISFSLENRGTKDIINPKVEINGKGMIYTMKDFVRRLSLDNCATIDDTVKVVWQFLWDNYYHYTVSTETSGQTVKPIRTFNVFGAGQCQNVSQLFCATLKYLGYNANPVGLNWYHVVGLLKLADRDIVLDGDLKSFYTQRDNKTLADFKSLWWDRELVSRNNHGQLLGSEGKDDDNIALGYTDLKRTWFTDYSNWPIIDSMHLRIRPGEKITFLYDSLCGKYFSYYNAVQPLQVDYSYPLPNSSMGVQDYHPALSNEWLSSVHEKENVGVESKCLSSIDSSRLSSVVIDFQNPFVFTNGRILLSYTKRAKGMLAVSCKKDYEPDYRQVFSVDASFSGSATDTIELFSFIRPQDLPANGDPMTNKYFVRLEWFSDKANGITIDSLRFVNDFQLNPNALPRIRPGANTIKVRDRNGEPFENLVYSHSYKVIENIAVPDAPSLPVFPTNRAVVNSSQFEFEWQLPVGLNPAAITDFNIMVSEYPDFRFPVSSVFNKLTSQQHAGSTPRWKIPVAGLLNPNTTYYWKVAVRSSSGVWSSWSPAWQFTVSTPGIPLHPRYRTASDSVVLTWDSNTEGTKPAQFYILASNERGFAYANSFLVDSTTNNQYTVKYASVMLPYAFYRVVAIDSLGRKSGISDLVSLEDRLLFNAPSFVQNTDSITINIAAIQPADFYGRSGPPDYTGYYQVDSLVVTSPNLPDGLRFENNRIQGLLEHDTLATITLIGKTTLSWQTFLKQLTIRVNHSPKISGHTNSRAYIDSLYQSSVLANDLNRDRINYTVVQAPSWLSIDSGTGTLSGYASSKSLGRNFCVVRVADDFGGSSQDTLWFDVVKGASKYTISPKSENSVFYSDYSNSLLDVSTEDTTQDDQLTYQLMSAPDWMSIDPVSGELHGTAPPGEMNQEVPVTVVIVSDKTEDVEVTFVVKISRLNTPPVFTSAPETIGYSGGEYVYHARAVDPDRMYGDSVRLYKLLEGPAWLQLDGVTGRLTGKVPAGSASSYLVKLGAVDNWGDTAFQSYTLHVQVPQEYHMRQNYPNPFTTTTTIEFSLPKGSYVEVVVFDSKGQKLNVTSGTYPAGYHKMVWNGARLPGGVYLAEVKIFDNENRRFQHRFVTKMLKLN